MSRLGWLLCGAFASVIAVALLAVLLISNRIAAPRPQSAETAATAAPSLTHIDDVACWFATPADRHARCGILRVPERRGAAQSRILELRFAVLGSAATTSADPVVYIAGGPGEPAQLDAGSISHWWSLIDRESWLQNRDLVLLDARGAGLSQPSMDCPELADAAAEVLEKALPLSASNAIWANAAGRCHERLTTSGIDLTNYNTATIVADFKDLLSQLGLRKPILLASSYGTRVALRLAADPSMTIGAMILDGVDPPEAHEFTDGATGAEAAFSAVFTACLADLSCHTAFPDIVGQFNSIVARAATDPIRLSLPNPQGGTLTAQLDDAKLIETLFYAFYDWRRLEELPAVIAAVAAGDTVPLVPLARYGLETYAGGASLGLYLSVECHDDFFFNPPEEVNRAAAAAPRFRKFALSTLPLAACPAWPAGEASPAEHAPLTRDVPTLMLVGALDPATPPQWAEEAAAHLPHAYVVKFPGVGHGVLGVQLCASRLVDRMLADPLRRPDDNCLAAPGSPRFRTALATNPPSAAARSVTAAPHRGQTGP